MEVGGRHPGDPAGGASGGPAPGPRGQDLRRTHFKGSQEALASPRGSGVASNPALGVGGGSPAITQGFPLVPLLEISRFHFSPALGKRVLLKRRQQRKPVCGPQMFAEHLQDARHHWGQRNGENEAPTPQGPPCLRGRWYRPPELGLVPGGYLVGSVSLQK